VQIAERLLGSIRRDDALLRSQDAGGIGGQLDGSGILARLGGDKFTILLDNIRNASEGVRVAERIQQSIQAPFDIDGQTVFATTRSCPRFPFSPAVEATDIQADTRILGRLSDISRNGCYVDTINPFAKDAAVTLTITREKQSFKTHAKVVYAKVGMGMGLLFTTAEPEQLRVLGSWLGELAGGKVGGLGSPSLSLQPEAANGADQELRKIVTELIALLNVKSILNDSEGMALLRNFQSN
jgi:hypothetical protein